MTSLRAHLTTRFLAVLCLAMGLMGGLVWRAVESQYLETQRENLLAQAEMTAAALFGQDLPASLGGAYSQTSNVQPGIHTRLIGEQGVVINLSALPEGALVGLAAVEGTDGIPADELLQREEIVQALQGQSASVVRRVTQARRRVLYAAVPVWGVDGTVSGVVYLAMPLPAGGLPAGLVAQLGGAVLLTGLLAGLTGLYLARRIARPIEQVAGAASAVSAGNLGRRVDLHSGVGELDRLGQAFDRMSESLQRSDQAKIAFIADVTHELRTPLTVIKGTLETLEDGALDDVVGRGPLLEAMGTETERLIRLVNDLLVLTRADAGSLDLDLRPLDLDDLARWRCENLAPLAARKQVKLLAGVEAQSCWVNGDADRLTQVLDNLLDNALRHSPAGGVVQVETRRVGEEIVCCVSDQGPGIPAEHLPHIFERFYRADASRGRMSGGAGLGLAIARSLVQAHGGRIQVESRAGEGACFSLYLPAIAGDCPPTDTQLTSS